MNIYDLEMGDIRRVSPASSEEIREILRDAREPLIISGDRTELEFLESWDLDFLGQSGCTVPVQKPEPDGMNYFRKYDVIDIERFVKRIRDGEALYIGAREIMSDAHTPSTRHGLASLAEQISIPSWVDTDRVLTVNLWAGAGNNKTLLHYDPWDSMQLIARGTKDFYVFPPSETPRMHQVEAYNLPALFAGRVLHSKVRAVDVQDKYAASFSKARGLRGTVGAGEAIIIPAGYWHFVESHGTNVAINLFLSIRDRKLFLSQPLRSYWFKTRITLQPIRLYSYCRSVVVRSVKGLIRVLRPCA